MPYSLSIPQDRYCRDECKCGCGYSAERILDNWGLPPQNQNVSIHTAGKKFYEQWLEGREQWGANGKAPEAKRRTVGDIWSRGNF